MSLVKASHVSTLGRSIRVGADMASPPPETTEDGPSPEAMRVRELEEELRDALDRLAAAERSADERESEALERGRAEGEEAASKRFEKDWTNQKDAFLDALSTCVVQLDTRFAELESFALDLAGTALARVIGDASHRRELLAATIAHHVNGLALDTVVAVQVSADDVPDVAALASSLPPAVASRVRITGDLVAGECRVDLLAGSLNLGLGEQSARIAETMERLRS